MEQFPSEELNRFNGSTPGFSCWSQSPHQALGAEPLHGVRGWASAARMASSNSGSRGDIALSQVTFLADSPSRHMTGSIVRWVHTV